MTFLYNALQNFSRENCSRRAANFEGLESVTDEFFSRGKDEGMEMRGGGDGPLHMIVALSAF